MEGSSSPAVTMTLENGGAEPQKKTINFQCGLLRETETFIGEDVGLLSRDSLLDFVSDMLCIKVGQTDESIKVHLVNPCVFNTHAAVLTG